MQCCIHPTTCSAMETGRSILDLRLSHPASLMGSVVCCWGSFTSLLITMVQVPLARQKPPTRGRSLRHSAQSPPWGDKVLGQGADPWDPRWLQSAVQDKIFQWWADSWGPLWSKSAALDRQISKAHRGWSHLRVTKSSNKGQDHRPILAKAHLVWLRPPMGSRISLWLLSSILSCQLYTSGA